MNTYFYLIAAFLIATRYVEKTRKYANAYVQIMRKQGK